MIWVRISRDDGTQSIATEARVREMLEGAYKDADQAIEAGKKGHTLTTPFAYYEWRERF